MAAEDALDVLAHVRRHLHLDALPAVDEDLHVRLVRLRACADRSVLQEHLPVVAPVLHEVVERDGLARAEDVHGAEGVLGAHLHQREHLVRQRLEEVLQEERDLLEAGHRVEAVGVRRVVVALHELHRVALARRGQVHGFQSQRKLEPADPVALKVGAEGERSHGEFGSVGGRARRAKNRGGSARCACEWCKWGNPRGADAGRAQWPRIRSVSHGALSDPRRAQ
jgi:hypothetical protein